MIKDSQGRIPCLSERMCMESDLDVFRLCNGNQLGNSKTKNGTDTNIL